jgi:hypothetical protein
MKLQRMIEESKKKKKKRVEEERQEKKKRKKKKIGESKGPRQPKLVALLFGKKEKEKEDVYKVICLLCCQNSKLLVEATSRVV